MTFSKEDLFHMSHSMELAGQGFGQLSTTLSSALELQEAAETERVKTVTRTRRQFLLLLAAMAGMLVLVLVVGTVLLIGQIRQNDDLAIRSALSRERQQCATALQVEFNTRLGDAFALSGRVPRPAPDSLEVQKALADLNAITALLHRVDELCYGPIPNPNPIPGDPDR